MAYEQNAVPPATALRSSSASAKALSRAHLDRRRSAAAHGLRRDDITRVSAAALAQSDGSEARFPSPQCTDARNHVPMSALQRASFCGERQSQRHKGTKSLCLCGPQWYGETIGFWDGNTLVAWTANVIGWTMSHSMFEH